MLLLVCLFLSTIFASEEHHLFQEWKERFGKNYSSPREEKIRFTNFLETVQRVQKRFSVSPKGGAKFGLTKFADLSSAEFRDQYLMKKQITPSKHTAPERAYVDVPKSHDWRAEGAVTAVQHQGACGSCWAFAATATIESAWMLKYNLTNQTMKLLSQQQIVDCDTEDGGCSGGEPDGAYDYIMKVGGQEISRNYPYTGKEGVCQFKKDRVYANIKSHHWACDNDNEKQLLQSAFTQGPLTICVDARNWQDYQSGVLTAWDCSWINKLDHCVQAVGWDLSSATPYWIARNSWGTDWGEDGYIRLEYGTNACGLAAEASYVVAA